MVVRWVLILMRHVWYRFICPRALVYGTVVYRHTKSHLSCIRLSSADEYCLLYYAGASTSRGQTVRGLMIGSTTFFPLIPCNNPFLWWWYSLCFKLYTTSCNRFRCTLDTPRVLPYCNVPASSSTSIRSEVLTTSSFCSVFTNLFFSTQFSLNQHSTKFYIVYPVALRFVTHSIN
jgi:hypothetical protein